MTPDQAAAALAITNAFHLLPDGVRRTCWLYTIPFDLQGRWPAIHLALSRPAHLVCARCRKPLQHGDAEVFDPSSGRHTNPQRRGWVRHPCGVDNRYLLACASVDIATDPDWYGLILRLLAILNQQHQQPAAP